MSDYREESEKAKQAKRGIIEQRPFTSNKKKKNRYRIIVDWSFFDAKFWKNYCIGKYVTLRDAEKAANSASKQKYYTNIRIEEI